MKALLTGFLALGLAVMTAGCDKESEKSTPEGENNAANTKKTYKLELPTGATNITQGGEAETIKIELDKGDDFDQEVTVSFEAPAGITVDPKEAKIGKGKNEVEVKVSASDEAKTGEHSIKAMGKSADMQDVSETFKVEVKAP